MVGTNSITSNGTIDVMDLDKLRQEIIDRLKDVDDVDHLNELNYLVWKMNFGPFDGINLTPRQVKILNDIIEEVKNGRYVTLEDEIEDIEKWIQEN